eukprot:TRINITY_DN5200_c0_g2_i1.p2 TRINITY_DN5200_c0_g2~~TRINITY_DN5200_c0_g2_i1.p2  ORF type:complete len:180 (-),score=87.90 TRINITY_DN5200_c0_g2_i1:262-801(-)
MADAPKPAGGAKGGDAPARPLGPDGKPIPGPAEVRQIQAARKMAQQQAQVEEVIGIMHTNVENVLERDRKLGDLEERADALQDGCAQFEKQAAAMKNKFWLENLKSIIAGAVVGLIVLGLLYWKFFMDTGPQYPPPGYYPPPPPPPAPAAPAAGGDAAGGGDEAAGGGDAGDSGSGGDE